MVVETGSAWWFARFVPHLRHASVWLWRELAAFARPVLVAETLRRVSAQFDALMLGHFGGAARLGQYRNGMRLADQPTAAFVSVTAYILYPAFARIGNARQRISAAARRTYWMALTVVIPVSAAAIPLGVPLALILLGPQWRPAGHAIAGLSGIVLGGAIISIASELFKSIGRPGALVGVQLVTFVAVASTVTVGAIEWGLLGVAIAMSISALVSAAYALVCVCDLLDISSRQVASWFAGPATAAALMVAAMLAYTSALEPLNHAAGLRILLTLGEVVVGAAVYIIVLATIDGPRRREARRLLSRDRSRGPSAGAPLPGTGVRGATSWGGHGRRRP
jgi:O-antigen/teichoic acid export membrane protein